MSISSEIHRCPKCNALVVDRRFFKCTTCHEKLPEDWIMSAEQVAKVEAIDQSARKEFATAMNDLEPENDPTTAESLPKVEPDSQT